jgi:hypothetical protein
MSGILVGVGASLLGGLFGSGAAKKRAAAARREKLAKEKELNGLEATRQLVINPYEGTKDLSFMAKDLSGQMSNPFANLSVATQAAEMQIEESDIALANTLDTLRATGASAGGATALAQAALKSKQDVSASIEQQEARNEQLRAQGEAALQSQRISEQQRLQGIQLSEGQRVQQADALGKQFKFNATEERQNAKLNRVAGQMQQAAQQEAQARADQSAAWAGAFTGAIGAVSAGITSGVFKKPPNAVSDRRLKKNINKIGVSPSGLNIYSFEYIDKDYGDGVWQGVMSNEIPENAIMKHHDGFDRVNYSMLDVEFKQL